MLKLTLKKGAPESEEVEKWLIETSEILNTKKMWLKVTRPINKTTRDTIEVLVLEVVGLQRLYGEEVRYSITKENPDKET